MYKVLVTGSREWNDQKTILDALSDLLRTHQPSDITVIVGGARGADKIAKEIARFLCMNVQEFPADWDRFNKAAGPIRNAEMVAQKPDICLAFPTASSKGTIHCMKLAFDAGVPVTEYSPSIEGG